MNVGKRAKSILAVLLICGILLVSVPCRAYAAGPVFLGPALKYAIGAGLVAGGLYAANKDALNYAINDYWNKASDHIKHQWQNAVVYGTGIGIILLNDPLKNYIKDYLNDNYTAGENIIYSGTVQTVESLEPGTGCQQIGDWRLEGPFVSTNVAFCHFRIYNSDGQWEASKDFTIYEVSTWSSWGLYINKVDGSNYISLYAIRNGQIIAKGGFDSPNMTIKLPVEIVIPYTYTGDAAGFGNATEDRPDVKVPCPPVPAAEWPDSWLDNLLDDMNLTGNPALDDETFVEEGEWEWEWYWDDNVAHLYRVRKGEPPKEPDDEPIRIPPPLPPIPEIPYPEPEPIPQPAEPCPYCPPNPYPDGQPCPNPYCPNKPNPMSPPVPQSPNVPAEPCPYCPPNPYPSPDGQPCPNPYCPNQPNPQPPPQRPPDIQPYYDDPEINWEPLRRSIYELTEKFPFSLPWDLMRGIETLEGNQWDRQIRINVGDGIWPEMTIDLSIFDGIARITRVVLLIVFDLGLIYGTRRLMGGDV